MLRYKDPKFEKKIFSGMTAADAWESLRGWGAGAALPQGEGLEQTRFKVNICLVCFFTKLYLVFVIITFCYAYNFYG